MSRISFTQTEKAEWLDLFENYDQSAAAFCREFSLPYSSFRKWHRQASEIASRNRGDAGGVPVPQFVELVTGEPQRNSEDCTGGGDEGGNLGHVLAELDLGAGYVLRVYRTRAQNR